MRILLINSNRFKHPYPIMPFGILYVAESLRKTGHNVYFLDLCPSEDCRKDIHNAITSFQPGLIGISVRNIDDCGGYVTNFLLENVKSEVVSPCKEEFSGPIVVGGSAVGISGVEILEYFGLEYAVCGDGEHVMAEIAKRLENRLSLEGLAGLIIRRNGKILQDSSPFFVENLDSLPFPAPHKYLNLPFYRKFSSPLQIQTKRGCALKCAYCTYNRIEGFRYRLRNPELVADEIEKLAEETGINHIEFTDSNFNLPLNYAKEVLRAVIRKGLDLQFRTMGLNAGAVDEELVDLMVNAGFTEVDLGAESLCDTTLRGLAKNYTKEDIIRAGNLLHRKKIPITWWLLIGAPGETRETLLETLNTVVKLASKWDLIMTCVTIRVFKGTPLAEEMKQENQNCTSDNFLTPVKWKPEGISMDEIDVIGRLYYLRYPNFYVYYVNNAPSMWLVIVLVTTLRLFRSKQPIWRALILKRTVEKILGISAIKSFIFKVKNRTFLASLRVKI